VFKTTSPKILLAGAIISLVLALAGIAAMVLASSVHFAGSETVQVLRTASAFLTVTCLVYAGTLFWLWKRRRTNSAILIA